MRYKILLMGLVATITVAVLTQIRANVPSVPSKEATDFAKATTERLTQRCLS